MEGRTDSSVTISLRNFVGEGIIRKTRGTVGLVNNNICLLFMWPEKPINYKNSLFDLDIGRTDENLWKKTRSP